MSVLRSSRYNPGSVYSSNPQPHGPSALKDDTWDHRVSTESMRDDKFVDNQHQAYPSGSGNPAAYNSGSGNRESQYEDAYDERGGYGYDQHQHQVGYGGPQQQGYGYEDQGHAQQGHGYGDQRGGYGYGGR